jgi:cell division protein FtsL
MEHAGLLRLAGWENFYIIVGSSAAALTGLQFVVIVLASEVNAIGSGSGTRAFATPTVVHFCAVLLMSAIVSTPWPSLAGAAIALGACGIAGIAYVTTVVRYTRRVVGYVPVLEDWLFHGALPLIAYAAVLIAAVRLVWNPGPSLFAIGAATVILLFVGIHNAWDAVVYFAHQHRRSLQNERRKG